MFVAFEQDVSATGSRCIYQKVKGVQHLGSAEMQYSVYFDSFFLDSSYTMVPDTLRSKATDDDY